MWLAGEGEGGRVDCRGWPGEVVSGEDGMRRAEEEEVTSGLRGS